MKIKIGAKPIIWIKVAFKIGAVVVALLILFSIFQPGRYQVRLVDSEGMGRAYKLDRWTGEMWRSNPHTRGWVVDTPTDHGS